MSKYQDWLIDHIKSNPDFIRPERYRNEVLAFLREPLEDLCISRPKSRLKWGITLPFDNDYVTYVWFDALVNYLTALGYPDDARFEKFWPSVQHIVAKDILKPHGIYWPIMLKAAGIPVYQNLNVHGYWNIESSKMSKSLGNVVEPLELKKKYGGDAFRYFLMRDMVFGLDSSFSESALIQRINSDLANDLGNLFSRVLAMTHKYFEGRVPGPDEEADRELRLGLQAGAFKAVSEYDTAMSSFAFHKALMSIWEFINQMNKCIDVTAPWELAKRKETRRQLETVIYNLLEGLRVISGLIYPVMPETAQRMQRHLGFDAKGLFSLEDLKQWGSLPSGIELPKSTTLFPRIDEKQAIPKKASSKDSGDKKNKKVGKPEITLEDLDKVDLRIGTVTAAEPVPKAKKLLKLEVDIGEKRTVVAGIAGSYQPDALLGKQVVVVANLKPAKLMGVLSQGMLLAAAGGDGLVLVGPDGEVEAGVPLS
jgi:methionyl-tRNA synthetase